MASKSTFKIQGTEELIAKLEALPLAVSGKLLEKCVMEGAEIIRSLASGRAPYVTGNLSRNIEAQQAEQTGNRFVAAIGPNKKAWYGLFVERGTSKRPPKPYLRPAYDESKNTVKKLIGESILEEIEKVAEG